VAYGYTASGYGFVQDIPYAYIHEFTRTSMAGKIRRFKDGYTSLWEKISESLPTEVYCNTEVLEVRGNSNGVTVEFDKIIISGSFPLKNGSTYRSPISNTTGLLISFLIPFSSSSSSFFLFLFEVGRCLLMLSYSRI